MNPQIAWIPSPLASGVHAIRTLGKGQSITDPALAESLKPVIPICQQFQFTNQVWDDTVALAGNTTDEVHLVQQLADRHPQEIQPKQSQIAPFFVKIQAAVDSIYPTLQQDLTLRIGPIRLLWESMGPGILYQVNRQLALNTLSALSVVVMHPVLGGFGASRTDLRTVCFEGLLANPRPELPEIVRLAWHIVLAMGPKTSISDANLLESAAGSPKPAKESFELQSLRAVLDTANELGQVGCDAGLLGLAYQEWHLRKLEDRSTKVFAQNRSTDE